MGPVLLFDGVCHLCHAGVRAVATRDRAGRFRFASLQSRVGRELLLAAGEVASGEPAVVLVEGTHVWVRSDAVLEVARRLGPPWSLLRMARVVPRALRDVIYRAIARRRYRWFGRYERCPRPTPGLRERFLDADEFVANDPGEPGGAPDPPVG